MKKIFYLVTSTLISFYYQNSFYQIRTINNNNFKNKYKYTNKPKQFDVPKESILQMLKQDSPHLVVGLAQRSFDLL